MTEKISVILTVDDLAKALPIHEVIESVCEQTYENWELLVMADSTIPYVKESEIAHYLDGVDIRYYKILMPDVDKKIKVALQYCTGTYVTHLPDYHKYESDALKNMIEFVELPHTQDAGGIFGGRTVTHKVISKMADVNKY